MKKSAKILTLIGSILETIAWGLSCFTLIGIPFCALFVPLVWVGRTQALKGSRAWNIYMCIQTPVLVLLGFWVAIPSLLGYMFLLLDDNRYKH